MSTIAQFPDNECFFIGREMEEESGKEIHLLEHFVDGKRIRIGEYASVLDLVLAMDEITGVDRTGGAA